VAAAAAAEARAHSLVRHHLVSSGRRQLDLLTVAYHCLPTLTVMSRYVSVAGACSTPSSRLAHRTSTVCRLLALAAPSAAALAARFLRLAVPLGVPRFCRLAQGSNYTEHAQSPDVG